MSCISSLQVWSDASEQKSRLRKLVTNVAGDDDDDLDLLDSAITFWLSWPELWGLGRLGAAFDRLVALIA